MKALHLVQKSKDTKTMITMTGQIDENADYSVVKFDGIKEAHFNFAGISLINSTGLQRWIKFLETIPLAVNIHFEKCPVRVISQINMFPGFLAGRRVVINSFFAPYYCDTCDHSNQVLLDRTIHFGSGKGVAPEIPCEKCGKGMEFDGIEKKYFTFLAQTAA